MKGFRIESFEEARNEYKKLLEEGWKKTYRFNSLKRFISTFLKFEIIKNLLLDKLQNGRLTMKKYIYSNI